MKLFSAGIMMLTLMLVSCSGIPKPAAVTVRDDPALDSAIAKARTRFMASRKFDRFDVTILIRNSDGTWRRGSYNPGVASYPASCVKLPYLAAAMRWCRENGHPYDHLDYCVRPMIEVSDNVQTGVVVDAITGAPNYSPAANDETYQAWYNKRLYTENFLASLGLLGNQVVMHKTYPSNSGEGPSGAEKLARDTRGGNLMQPLASAMLMQKIIDGEIEPGATAYMRELLAHNRIDPDSAFGYGLPPGIIFENKIGMAYDTAEEIAYVVLPNGQEFIIAGFSNGRDNQEGLPYDVAGISPFAEMIIEELKLDAGCPPKIKVDNSDSAFTATGRWNLEAVLADKWGGNYVAAPAGSGAKASWNLNVPEAGLYEVSIWYPEAPAHSTSAPFSVIHASGTSIININQQKRGGFWYKLGDFQFEKGGGVIELTSAAFGVVVADAVMAVKWHDAVSPQSGTDVIVDNDYGAPHYTETGAWLSTNNKGFMGRSFRHAKISDEATATWTANLTTAGWYDVFVQYRGVLDGATMAKFVVHSADGEFACYADHSKNILKWVRLGSFRFNAGENKIMLTTSGSSGGKRVIADAVRFTLTVPAAPESK